MAVACFSSINAQVKYDTDAKRFTISSMRPNKQLVANAANNYPGTIPAIPSCAFVLEYGNGYFTTQNSNDEYYYSESKMVNPVLTLSGRYDTIKPPGVYSATLNPASLGSNTSQSLLNDGEYIRLTPIARSINVKDEMLFILTYKKPPQMAAGKLMFFYNSRGANAFIPILSVNEKIAESINEFNKLGTVNRIRNHFKENFTVPNSPATINGLEGGGYQNVFSWVLDSSLNIETEYNVFITLRTADNLPTANTINIEAAFLYSKLISVNSPIQITNNSQFTDTAFSSLQLPASFYPHDPNYITVLPKCIVKSSGIERVKYHIHFQNEGGGAAHRLKIKVHMDSRLAASIGKLNADSFRIMAGKKSVDSLAYQKLNDSTFRLDICFRKKTGNNIVDTDAQTNGIFDSSLSSNKVPFFAINELTMGDVYFELNVPKSEEADLAAQAEITFYSGGNIDMEPVFTRPDTLFIRNTCSGNLYPSISAIEKACECANNKQSGNCSCKWLGLCWCWWIVIALIIAIFIWLISRRSRRNSNNNNS